MDMNIQKYLAFIKTVEYGSFTKAAEQLNYSQSGISRMIQDLEETWHLTLLERDRSGVRLTSEGTCILPLAQELCASYQRLQTQIDALHDLQSGLIRIGTFSSVATHWLPKIIQAFQKDYPHIDYELLLGDYAEIEQWILQGRVDCGFIRLPATSALETIALHEDRLLAVLPLGHPLENHAHIPLMALLDEPFLLLARDDTSDVSDLLARHHIVPDIRFTTWDDYAIMSMVESGLGISLLPELILQRIPYQLSMKALDIPATRTIGIAIKNHTAIPLVVKKFLEYLPHRYD